MTAGLVTVMSDGAVVGKAPRTRTSEEGQHAKRHGRPARHIKREPKDGKGPSDERADNPARRDHPSAIADPAVGSVATVVATSATTSSRSSVHGPWVRTTR